jgi:NitT/TauT family transport system substrate-binding protein
LESEGFSADEIRVIAVPDIGQRMALLGSGELMAAMLPDPLATLVMDQGANLVIEDSRHPEFSHSVYSFRKAFIDQNPRAVRGFLAAIEEAVVIINYNPDQFNDLLTDRELVPESLSGEFMVPQFVTAGVPSAEQWEDVSDWIEENGLGIGEAAYSSSVTIEFLP